MSVSTVGTWLQIVAQDWLVLDITGNSGSALGIATALQFLPQLVFGLWGGVVADRYDKRRILMVTRTAMGIPALALGVLTMTGAAQIWQVYAFALTLGFIMLIDLPTAQSFVAELVPPINRTNAIALDGASRATARLVGPALAGVLINIIGIGPVLLINGFSFAVAILALKLIRNGELYTASRTSGTKGGLLAGLTYVRQRKDLVLALVLVGFVAAFGLNPQITTALMTKNVFHGGAGSYGLASTGFAVGSLAGSLLAARIGRRDKRLMIGGALAAGLLETASSLAPTYTWFLILIPPTGLVLVIFLNSVIITMQLDVTPEMRGRVSGLYFLVFSGTTPIGAPLIGWIAQLLGARAGLLTDGVVTLLATTCVAPFLIRTRHEQPSPVEVRDVA